MTRVASRYAPRVKRLLLLLAGLALGAACRMPEDPLPPEYAPAPRRIPPAAYRFEVELYELPLARAEALYGHAADEHAGRIALLIDERGLREELRALATNAKDVRRVARPPLEARPEERGLVAPGGADGWGAGLRLEFGARETFDWAPHELDFALAWTSPQGERLGSAAGTTPVPGDRDVVVWCLPPRALAAQPEPRTARAIAALVRVQALAPER